MEPVFQFVSPPGRCEYLPEQTWQLRYELFSDLAAADYLDRMKQGWRRFGYTLFRPQCPNCQACQSLRVPTATFCPNRSQRRCRQLNQNVVTLRIGTPSVTRAKLDLYDRYHAFQSTAKGWPVHDRRDGEQYAQSFVENPFPTEEWCYYLGRRLIGVGYVDTLPEGLSAIYFYYDPVERQRSLGTWNVLCIIEEAARRELPFVYLGFYVAGSQSLAYKALFRPNQVLGPDGIWRELVSLPSTEPS